jgi:hypothetical protein
MVVVVDNIRSHGGRPADHLYLTAALGFPGWTKKPTPDRERPQSLASNGPMIYTWAGPTGGLAQRGKTGRA